METLDKRRAFALSLRAIRAECPPTSATKSHAPTACSRAPTFSCIPRGTSHAASVRSTRCGTGPCRLCAAPAARAIAWSTPSSRASIVTPPPALLSSDQLPTISSPAPAERWRSIKTRSRGGKFNCVPCAGTSAGRARRGPISISIGRWLLRPSARQVRRAQPRNLFQRGWSPLPPERRPLCRCARSCARTSPISRWRSPSLRRPPQYSAAGSAIFDICDPSRHVMSAYHVSFFKTLLSSDGHPSKCLQTELISPTRKALRKP
jgi:hypothetical protein